MSVWFWNINGFAGAEADVLAFLKHERPDVLVLIDSQLTDLERIKDCLSGWKLLHESRPHDTHSKRLFGGITVLWRSENVRVCRESGYPKGVLSFVVQDNAERRRPVPFVALYSPPLSSRLNRCGKHWSQDIMDFAEIDALRLWSEYGFVAVGGDANSRPGTSFHRRTEDVVENAASARTEQSRQWHLRTNLRPLYGQAGQHPGVCTSRNDNGTAEPDGVSVCKKIPLGWAVRALPPPPWELYSTRGGVHRPVGVAVSAPAVESVQDEESAPSVDHGATDTSHPSIATRLSPPAYGSQEYHDMADSLEQCISQVAAQLEANEITPAAAVSSLAESLVAVQQKHFEPRQVPHTHPGSRRVHPPVVRSLSRRNPTERFRRLANGMRVPASIQRAIDARHKLVSKTLAEKSELQRNRDALSSEEFAAASERLKAKLHEAQLLSKQTSRKLSALHSAKYESTANMLSHLILRNPRKFHRLLKPKLPQPFEVYDESSGPSAQQNSSFREFFAGLLRGRPERAAGVGEKYRGCVPPTDPATMGALVALVQWQEVYAVLFPAHRNARRHECLPGCVLCPLFADHVDEYAHGNTHMQPPEHKPRLWTSKSAGPDGVFAETLRWTCPKLLSDRHEYRTRICKALASIFNRILADGTVPDCPQFAEATMTALYKGVGDRKDPSNYRGIAVPNVLAKLFGLVLGTRLSHWAVVNGVISPAQAGFVVLHGCEYHIFTLLEVLRQRVRRGRDTCLVFIDFKKAYDSVSQDVIWEILDLLGIPAGFTSLLKSWAAQSRITLCVGGDLIQPAFPQETGVPQGGVLSPILFNIVLEILLRYVNARASELGVEMSDEPSVVAAGAAQPPPSALRLLALAYADDVVLICPDRESAQAALDLVQEWATDFGMTIGVGQGKTQAMFVSAVTVKQACANDVNGMLKRAAVAPSAAAAPPHADFEDPDDDNASFVDDDDEPCDEERDDPSVEQSRVPPQQHRGQASVRGELRGARTGKPRPYEPRPLPPLPALPELVIASASADGDATPVPWTSLYKYLGFMLRADLLDDHAYARVEHKTKAAAERLFPFHRLVRAWPLGLKLQLLQSLVLSISANVMPLLTSMRCASESKTKRLDQLWKRITRSVLRLHGSARHAYVTSEAGMGDVTGCITQHRMRLKLSLEHHPLRGLAAPPIACQVLTIAKAEAASYRLRDHSLLIAPWPFVTDRITAQPVSHCDGAGWQPPLRRSEVAPYASLVGRVSERGRWIGRMQQRLDWTCDSFVLRPPSSAKSQTAALHWSSRLISTDVGGIPRLCPLSTRGPHSNGSVVALSRLLSDNTHLISKARQGVWTMHHYPFATAVAAPTRQQPGGKRKEKSDPGTIRFRGKSCHLCVDGDDGPSLDLWHALFECPTTSERAEMIAVRTSCVDFLLQLCDAIEAAVGRNSDSMNDSRAAGVSHEAILKSVDQVRKAVPAYDWNCLPGQWLMYTLLLALPFPAHVVRPDAQSPVWLCKPKRRVRGVQPERDLTGMPALPLPMHSDAQFLLPELVGQMYDCTILPGDAMRPAADAWCRFAENSLLRTGRVVRPLRVAAETVRAAARVAEALEGDGHSTMSFVSSTNSEAGTGSTADSGEP